MSAPESRFTLAQRALRDLESFVAQPVVSKRDRAGVIKAFEYTYELFWKTFQDLATTAGVATGGPKPALRAAFKLGIIDDEEAWLAMVDARNLTSHTYNEALAVDICNDIATRFLPALQHNEKRIAAYLTAN